MIVPSPITQWLLSYGTLRLNQGNYKSKKLKELTEHIGTFRLPGYAYYRSLAGVYTGNEEDSLVVDLFKLIPGAENNDTDCKRLYGLHYHLDLLESVHNGLYIPVLEDIKLPSTEEIITAKIYLMNRSYMEEKNKVATGDYLSPMKHINYQKLDKVIEEWKHQKFCAQTAQKEISSDAKRIFQLEIREGTQ